MRKLRLWLIGVMCLLAFSFSIVGCASSPMGDSDQQVASLKILARSAGHVIAKKYPEVVPVADDFCTKFQATEDQDIAETLLAVGVSYLLNEYGEDELVLANIEDLLILMQLDLSNLDGFNMDLEQMQVIVGAFCEGVRLPK